MTRKILLKLFLFTYVFILSFSNVYSDNHNVLQIGSEYQWEWDSGKLGAYNYEAFGNWSHIGNTGTAASSDAWHHYA